MEHIIKPEALQFLKDFFASIWHIFEAVPVPFLENFTIADLTIGLLGCSAFILILKKILDSGGAVGFRSGEGKLTAYRTIFGKEYGSE